MIPFKVSVFLVHGKLSLNNPLHSESLRIGDELLSIDNTIHIFMGIRPLSIVNGKVVDFVILTDEGEFTSDTVFTKIINRHDLSSVLLLKDSDMGNYATSVEEYFKINVNKFDSLPTEKQIRNIYNQTNDFNDFLMIFTKEFPLCEVKI